ncbi:MAG: serine/threonine protein kinase [Verrucomicrobia bacterium]|nr:MAG: serine/threonine protein kinase [Verrucomicrobiota bacterium]
MKPTPNAFLLTRCLLLRLLVAACFLPLWVLADNWPQWRGPAGTGVSAEKNLPLHWGTNENVRWRVPLPERGNSTPIVWGKRVFLTQAAENRRTLMCFNRADGKLLWQSGVTYPEKESTHETNPLCSASPVADGERVIASFASAGLSCYDFDGKQLWHRDLGKQAHIWGNGASPIIHGDLCILNFGPGERTFLIAVSKKTGETVWQVDEPGGDSGQEKPGEKPNWVGSWSTPIVIKVNGREELIMTWPKRVAAYDPKAGKELWTCGGLNPLIYTSPLYSDGTIVAMGGFMGMALAVKADGRGDVTQTRRLWHHPKTKQRIGSGVIHHGHIYILNDPGVAECYELKSGKMVWEERLSGKGPDNSSWSSMVLADGRLYVINHSGDTFVLKASPKFELLATNSLGETDNASLAVSDGDIFIRTHKALWCLRENGEKR